MRVIEAQEMLQVCGGNDECSAGDGGNNYGGVTDTGSIGDDLVEIYEGLVQAASHIIERVADAL